MWIRLPRKETVPTTIFRYKQLREPFQQSYPALCNPPAYPAPLPPNDPAFVTGEDTGDSDHKDNANDDLDEIDFLHPKYESRV